MISYRDTTFCISPNCTCVWKLTPEIEAAAAEWWKGCKGEPPIAKAYFCGGKPEGWPYNQGESDA